MRNKAIIILIVFFIFSCTQREMIIPPDRILDGKHRNIYLVLEFDDYYRPVFSKRISGMPDEIGSEYYLVDLHSSTDRVIRSFHVKIEKFKEKKMNPKRPLIVAFKWTKRGFEQSVYVSERILHTPSGQPGGEVAKIALMGVIFTISTAGGFSFGLIKGSLNELKRPLTNGKEFFLGYNSYEYDRMGRITRMVQYTPTARPVDIIRTSYHYRGNSPDPHVTEIYSVPENKTRKLIHAVGE